MTATVRARTPGVTRWTAPDERRSATAPRWRRASLLPTILATGFLLADFASRSDLLAAAVAVGALGLAGLRFAIRGRLDRIGWATLALLTYQLVWGYALGAGPSLGELAKFASFDGRMFVAYVPFLVYATVSTTLRDVERLRTLLRLLVVAGAVLLVGGLAKVIPGAMHRGHFYGLTSSHHVPGLLFGVVAVALAVWPSPRSVERDRLLALVAVVLVGASGSRTSATGLLLAVGYLALTTPTVRKRVRNVVLASVGVLLALLLSGRMLSTVEFVTSSDFISSAATEFSEADTVEEGKQLDAASPGDASLSNVLIRFGVWRAGADEFLRSPVVGIGSWRLNDPGRTYFGVRGVFDVATGGTPVHSGGFGAHNLVLQTLAENGLVGLALLVWPWRLLFVRFGRLGGPGGRAGKALIVFGAGTIFTSNSLISPALCFPLLVCAMTYARLPSGRVTQTP